MEIINPIHKQLLALVGKPVTVENVANDELAPKLQIQVHGILEDYTGQIDETSPMFMCRVKECYEGTSHVSFPPTAVREIFTHNSGRVTVQLK